MESPASDNPRVEWVGDRSLLMRVGEGISRECHSRVFSLFHLLTSRKPDHIRSIHPAYDSLLLTFDPAAASPDETAEMVGSLIRQKGAVVPSQTENGRNPRLL